MLKGFGREIILFIMGENAESAEYLADVVERMHDVIVHLELSHPNQPPYNVSMISHDTDIARFYRHNVMPTIEDAEDVEVKKLAVVFPERNGEISISFDQSRVDCKERIWLQKCKNTRIEELRFKGAHNLHTKYLMEDMFRLLGEYSNNGPSHQIEVACLASAISDKLGLPYSHKRVNKISGLLHDIGRGTGPDYYDGKFKNHGKAGEYILKCGGLGDYYKKKGLLAQKEIDIISEIIGDHNSPVSEIQKSGRLIKSKMIVRDADTFPRIVDGRGVIESLKRVAAYEPVSEWPDAAVDALERREKRKNIFRENTLYLGEEVLLSDTLRGNDVKIKEIFLELKKRKPEIGNVPICRIEEDYALAYLSF